MSLGVTVTGACFSNLGQHGRHFTISGGRKVDEKGLRVEDFSSHVIE